MAFFPTSVETRPLGKPIVTYIIIAVNIVVYLLTSYENGFIQVSEYWISIAALPPITLLFNEWYRLFTSMFLHGNIFHILFNMYFLFIFGREVEGILGWFRYLILYILSGLVASVFHIGFTGVLGISNLFIPALGASGAISGILGAFLMLYPHRDMTVCWFIWFIPWCFTAKAVYLLLIWFGMQIILGYTSAQGVAFFAHAGGFIGGIVLLYPILPSWIKAERVRMIYNYFIGEYILVRRRGIERDAKLLFLIFIALLLIGSIYSMYYSYGMESDLYTYMINVYSEGYSSTDYAIYSVSKGVLTYPPSSYPRIVWNRLYWAGLIEYKPSYEGPLHIDSNIIAGEYNIKIRLRLDASAVYDSNGILKYMDGSMVTDVLLIRGIQIGLRRGVSFNFNIEGYGPLGSVGMELVSPMALLSSVILVGSFYIISYKDREIVID